MSTYGVRAGSRCLMLILAASRLASGQAGLPDFANLSLDELANIKVTSFTNKEQKLSQVAGAVYVITQEQIARSGLTSVPELLRLAPGVDVARVNGNQWSISVRGPVGAYNNKLLVLIDGRSIYSPIFSGVYWEVGMPLLDNIERIEVIRGPGATIWGANAVLGVVNIITKTSQDTRGMTLTSGGGNSERGFASLTMGAQAGSVSYRGYFGGSDSAPLKQSSGAAANDARSSMQAGFRIDGSHQRDGSHKDDTWTLEGDLFRGEENNTAVDVSLATASLVTSPSRFHTSAASLTGEWRRRLSENGELRVKSYLDYADRPQPQAPRAESKTWDTEIRYDFTAGHGNHISVGAGERLISDSIVPKGEFSFAESQTTYTNLNAFGQDEIHFAHDSLVLTLGAKLERNHFAGWGTEPSANLLWMPTKRHSLWISAARALRTPSLYDVSVEGAFTVIPGSAATAGLPVVATLVASPGFATESVKDFEAGYRAQITKAFSADLTVFYDRFSNILSTRSGYPVFEFSSVPYLNALVTSNNDTQATGKGAEASIAWQVLRGWKLEGSYTYNILDKYLSASAPPGTAYGDWKEPSRNKWRLQSYVNLSNAWKLDTLLYGTSAGDPTTILGPNTPVPLYTRLDVRVGYKAGRNWQLSLTGQNLLQARHIEALAEFLSAGSYVNRSVYLKSTWQF